MSMEIKLTDIRGEPPLKVGEFILDRDNNVLYVGSGDFELDKCRGAVDIYAWGKATLIPPNKAYINIKINDIGNITSKGIITPLKTYKHNISVSINDNSIISARTNFSDLSTYNVTSNININDDNIIKESGKIVT